jgi:hypothetical protein
MVYDIEHIYNYSRIILKDKRSDGWVKSEERSAWKYK